METQALTSPTLDTRAAAAPPTIHAATDPLCYVSPKFAPEGWSVEDEFDSAAATEPLPTPRALRSEEPGTPFGREVARAGREAIRRVLQRREGRLMVVVGPCSLHDEDAGIEYAERLAILAEELQGRLLIVMRAYFEKPRTTVGWRGLINDPHLDGSFDMAEGLRRARRILARITSLGLPVATEMLDTATPAYFADLVSLAAIGARTTESQQHRALASGLGMPVGFKNGTDGDLQTALDALLAARAGQPYLGIDAEGRSSVVRTAGNPDAFLILRGGKKTGPNYEAAHVAEAERRLLGLESINPPSLLVDCSHANSGSDPARQALVCESVARQRRDGSHILAGVMLESNLHPGKQALVPTTGREGLRYGVSITDGCIGWDETERLLRELAAAAAATA